MRYTHAALLLFGAGLVLGLVVVAFDLGWPQRVASAMMALGIAALPFTALADWRRAAKPPAKKRRARRKRRRTRKPKPVASRKSP